MTGAGTDPGYLLPAYGPQNREVEEIAGQKLAVVRERITQLTTMENVLARLIRKCSRS